MRYVVMWDGSEWAAGEALVYGAFPTLEAARRKADQVVYTHVGKWATETLWVGGYRDNQRVCRILALNDQPEE